MPIAALWSLVVGLALLALGLAYKIGELTHRVDRINKEAETLRSELNALQKSKDKEISDIKETYQTELEKVIKHNRPLKESDNNLTEMHENVLELLFKKPSTIEDICKSLKLTIEETKYYLNDLHGMDMADPPAPYSSSSNWRIDQEGREYVMSKRKSA